MDEGDERRVLGLQPGLDTLEAEEAVEEEAGAGKKDEGQGDLRDDQRRSAQRAHAAGAAAVATLLQRGLRVGVRRLQGGQNTEQQSCADRRQDGHEGDDAIERDLAAAWHRVGQDARQQADHPGADQQACEASRDAEQRAFGEELPHESPAARAKGRADGQLAASAAGSGDEQARDVGARDHEHEADRGLKQQQAESNVADDVLSKIERAGCRVERPSARCAPGRASPPG